MAQLTHETLAVTTGQSPATTRASMEGMGCTYVLMSTTADVRFTTDWNGTATAPVITGGSEVGTLLRSTDVGIILTIDEFLALRLMSVSGTARVQFEFRNQKFVQGL